jgi:uncharacterized protein (DUF1499 family)
MSSITSQHNTSITEMNIIKAKRKDGVYVCSIYASEKQPFLLSFPSSSIIEMKRSSSTILLQSRKMYQYMDELNEYLIDTVKQNTNAWFNTNMDEELIDEYYISTLGFDKKRGEYIRLKLTNMEELEDETFNDGKYNVTVALKHIKFFRQKFYGEFELKSMEQCSNEPAFVDDLDDFVEDDDVPVPTFEEAENMRVECINDLEIMSNQCQTQLNILKDKLTKIEKYILYLKKCKDVISIIKACEDCHLFMCE